jgi:glycyl-tRNA synthetase beta chain
MPDLLLELLSEEIPARMQAAAAIDLQRLVTGALTDRGLLFEAAKSFAGPRRLTLAIAGLPAVQPDVSEEKKGPRVDAPQKAIDGFLRSAGVSLDQCRRQADSKGEFYIAVVRRAGRAVEQVLTECLPLALAQLPWPKSMRWRAGTVRWVRPLHRIVCTFDGEIVPFSFAGVESANHTLGHRFLASGEIAVRRFEDYESKLAAAFVILESSERRDIILHEARQKTFALGLELIEDDGLLDEVAGLVEWPVALIGTIDGAFMDLPTEVLQTSMRRHQRFFALRDISGGTFADRFLVVANIAADDGGREIVAGNERVLRARLSDAQYFWDQDRSRPLASRIPELRNIVFHAKAGTMHGRVVRITIVAMCLARMLNLSVRNCCRAAWLAKADLLSGVVGEFPELQGIMGGHYAAHDGEDEAVANAVRDHYKPLGPGDRVPEEPVSFVVALADKIDCLVTLWHAGEKPTGSKDPFALRRAGLGIIRIILENRLRLSLSIPISLVLANAQAHAARAWEDRIQESLFDPDLLDGIASELVLTVPASGRNDPAGTHGMEEGGDVASDVLEFLADRLKVALREEGIRHDLIDAVFALAGEDDLVRLVWRVKALAAFLDSADGSNLLIAYRRAVNILRIEEKRDGGTYRGEPDPHIFETPEEKSLFAALGVSREEIAIELERERFGEAMTVMARLRAPVDGFFEKVTVNASQANLRRNRLLLLSRLRSVLHAVADFSRIEG